MNIMRFVLARTRNGEMGLSIAIPLPAWEGTVAQATHKYTTLFWVDIKAASEIA